MAKRSVKEGRAETGSAPPLVYLKRLVLGLLLLVLLGLASQEAYNAWAVQHRPAAQPPAHPATSPTAFRPPHGEGSITSIVAVNEFTPNEVLALAKQNYGTGISVPTYSVTQVLFTYVSTGADSQPITVYARAYLPHTTHAPILAMAPGTTGIGDQCAASLEQPALHNWANYESHMMAYANQGYAGVITDYAGMRDPTSTQPYMIGVSEGQAVLDSIRALEHLPQARGVIDSSHIFAAGYSQGGHAAYWADTVSASYAPDIHLSGIIGWGPVMDVTESLADISHGSTLDWFGPYVLVSYADYYKTSYPLGNILLPKWQPGLVADVLGHCIDSDVAFWGTKPGNIYTPQFLAALSAGSLPTDQFGQLGPELTANQAGNERTTTPKLINEGQLDNVVLPAQQQAAMKRICANSTGPAALKMYAKSSHYNVMRDSFRDTLTWMTQIIHRSGTPPSTCS